MPERRDERGEGSPEERAARLFPVPHSDITDAEVVKSIAAAIRDAEAAMKERAAECADAAVRLIPKTYGHLTDDRVKMVPHLLNLSAGIAAAIRSL